MLFARENVNDSAASRENETWFSSSHIRPLKSSKHVCLVAFTCWRNIRMTCFLRNANKNDDTAVRVEHDRDFPNRYSREVVASN